MFVANDSKSYNHIMMVILVSHIIGPLVEKWRNQCWSWTMVPWPQVCTKISFKLKGTSFSMSILRSWETRLACCHLWHLWHVSWPTVWSRRLRRAWDISAKFRCRLWARKRSSAASVWNVWQKIIDTWQVWQLTCRPSIPHWMFRIRVGGLFKLNSRWSTGGDDRSYGSSAEESQVDWHVLFRKRNGAYVLHRDWHFDSCQKVQSSHIHRFASCNG